MTLFLTLAAAYTLVVGGGILTANVAAVRESRRLRR